jgi:CMP-2-keto-3-deoxyoctulosonic acid synthetase
MNITSMPASPIETVEFIEQMRILENGFSLQSVPVSPSLPSVNEPAEAHIVLDYIENNEEQKLLLEQILGA